MNWWMPSAIIWTATAAMIRPVSRISGPCRCVRTSRRLIGLAKHISRKLMPMAQTSDREVEINPDWAVQVIAAVMVPGPAISGAPAEPVKCR